MEEWFLAKFTWPFMKQITSVSEKRYCYYAYVIAYAFYAERGKDVMRRTNEVSNLVGVSRRTLQYYDDEGLLLVERSENNHRMYSQRALERIWRVMIYKEKGFELRKIKHLTLASDNGKREYLRQRKKIIKSQIATLKEQMKFISSVLKNGMPQVPEERGALTYISRIEKSKKQICCSSKSTNTGLN